MTNVITNIDSIINTIISPDVSERKALEIGLDTIFADCSYVDKITQALRKFCPNEYNQLLIAPPPIH